jgi:hypothetical protein
VYFQRKQKDVSKENEFYMQLLQQALPVEHQQTQQPLPQQQQQQSCHNTSPEKSRGKAFWSVAVDIKKYGPCLPRFMDW